MHVTRSSQNDNFDFRNAATCRASSVSSSLILISDILIAASVVTYGVFILYKLPQ